MDNEINDLMHKMTEMKDIIFDVSNKNQILDNIIKKRLNEITFKINNLKIIIDNYKELRS